MKIISYNVNGIRAATKKGFIEWLKAENPDVICLQETKANSDQFETELLVNAGYTHYWFSAQKKGYSGVAIFSKTEPDKVVYGIGIEKYDSEGRFIRADFGDLSVVSVYHPSGSSGEERQEFKMQWLKDFFIYINELKFDRNKLILCGDFNICHRSIDIHDPIRNANTSGFLPEERDWMESFLDSGFIDSFREFNNQPNNYSWWSYRANARANNKGWRIDYILLSNNLRDKLTNSFILPLVEHSDHCPVGINIK